MDRLKDLQASQFHPAVNELLIQQLFGMPSFLVLDEARIITPFFSTNFEGEDKPTYPFTYCWRSNFQNQHKFLVAILVNEKRFGTSSSVFKRYEIISTFLQLPNTFCRLLSLLSSFLSR
jgi:hypothetical protein